MSDSDDKARVCVGYIAGAHGVRGDVRIASYTDDPMDIGAYGPVDDEAGERRFVVKAKRMAKGQVIAALEGVNDRNAAEALRGARLYVPREALPPAGDDEFYFEDLVGLDAVTVDGEPLGAVLAVQDFGAGPILEVGPPRGRSVLIPFTHEIVPLVDLKAGRIEIDPPAGLLDPVGKKPKDAEEGANG